MEMAAFATIFETYTCMATNHGSSMFPSPQYHEKASAPSNLDSVSRQPPPQRLKILSTNAARRDVKDMVYLRRVFPQILAPSWVRRCCYSVLGCILLSSIQHILPSSLSLIQVSYVHHEIHLRSCRPCLRCRCSVCDCHVCSSYVDCILLLRCSGVSTGSHYSSLC